MIDEQPVTTRTRVAAGIIACVAAMDLAVAAAPPARLDELDTVVITGMRPTPALWKVSNGGRRSSMPGCVATWKSCAACMACGHGAFTAPVSK
jgi:hypothetical protein